MGEWVDMRRMDGSGKKNMGKKKKKVAPPGVCSFDKSEMRWIPLPPPPVGEENRIAGTTTEVMGSRLYGREVPTLTVVFYLDNSHSKLVGSEHPSSEVKVHEGRREKVGAHTLVKKVKRTVIPQRSANRQPKEAGKQIASICVQRAPHQCSGKDPGNLRPAREARMHAAG